jgi:hypothetical protein
MREDKSPDAENELRDLEIELEDQFMPVHPDPEFVHRLRRRLTSPQEMTLESQNQLLNLALALGIVTAGLFALVAAARGIYEMLKGFGIIRKED